MADRSPEIRRKRSLSVDSSESTKAYKKRLEHAPECLKECEETARPELTDEERIQNYKLALRKHIGADSGEKEITSADTPLFFVELTPMTSHRGVACKHVACTKRITRDEYRITVKPGMNNVWRSPGKRPQLLVF